MRGGRHVPILGALALLLCALPAGGQDKKKEKDKKKEETAAGISYSKQVYPVIKSRCQPCHYPGDKKGGLDVSTHAALLKGGKRPNNIVPGDPDKSFLMKEIIGKDPPMPKNANPLEPGQIDLIAQWIKEGARNN